MVSGSERGMTKRQLVKGNALALASFKSKAAGPDVKALAGLVLEIFLLVVVATRLGVCGFISL
jgi:hypothetical protein